MANLKATHPAYAATIDDHVLMRDCYLGERAVKAKDITYLPATPGQNLDGMDAGKDGRKNYDAYKTRAVFPDTVSDAVEHLLGILHQKPATFELPKAMEELVLRASDKGEGLQALLRRINEQQLVAGRLGLLVDMPENPDPTNPLPFIAMYFSEAMINWDEGAQTPGKDSLRFVVLDESGYTLDMTSFEWKREDRHRVLMMGAEGGVLAEGASAKYVQALFTGSNAFNSADLKAPTLRGKPMEEIPFVFVNGKDTLPNPDNPPLLGLAQLCMAIYRGDADYRHCLFMQGQDTLVVIGGIKNDDNDGATRIGAGATLEVEMEGDAKFIGTASTGLSEMRSSLENDKKAANLKAGQLVDAMSAQKESGEALQTRVASQTATLNQIANTGAEALQKTLRFIAKWMGLDPEKVKVTPNLEFADANLSSKELVELQTAKTMGAPLAQETIHDIMRERGITKLTYEEEMAKIELEAPLAPVPGSELDDEEEIDADGKPVKKEPAGGGGSGQPPTGGGSSGSK